MRKKPENKNAIQNRTTKQRRDLKSNEDKMLFTISMDEYKKTVNQFFFMVCISLTYVLKHTIKNF
jgi:hypothetical protein